eukprot:comp22279_c0_seq1/m.53155 comp22279_c0_seq1/g.53155  ORF comp22279_c0_seq1/g.53155 comp22279_c0_seq1/m.53155 type:complete len:352 (-) comp22279_c0_seq1:342-1397(-)
MVRGRGTKVRAIQRDQRIARCGHIDRVDKCHHRPLIGVLDCRGSDHAVQGDNHIKILAKARGRNALELGVRNVVYRRTGAAIDADLNRAGRGTKVVARECQRVAARSGEVTCRRNNVVHNRHLVRKSRRRGVCARAHQNLQIELVCGLGQSMRQSDLKRAGHGDHGDSQIRGTRIRGAVLHHADRGHRSRVTKVKADNSNGLSRGRAVHRVEIGDHGCLPLDIEASINERNLVTDSELVRRSWIDIVGNIESNLGVRNPGHAAQRRIGAELHRNRVRARETAKVGSVDGELARVVGRELQGGHSSDMWATVRKVFGVNIHLRGNSDVHNARIVDARLHCALNLCVCSHNVW